jgi:N-acetyl-anhydromuramyl-L-alanine amidase AmpD
MAAADYGRARFVPAASGNYTNASRERSHNIDMIVIHVVQGSSSGAVNWFANPDSGVSAHYTVNKNGSVTQSVRNADIGYHAGHWATNTRSIGIEHGGYVSNPDNFSPAMYRASARLAAWCSRKHRIRIDRQHIIGHHQVPGCPGKGGGANCHTDPGRYFNWDKYLRLVKSYR